MRVGVGGGGEAGELNEAIFGNISIPLFSIMIKIRLSVWSVQALKMNGRKHAILQGSLLPFLFGIGIAPEIM